MLSCDTLSFEIINIFGFNLSASGVIFPIDFILLSIVTNSYGYKAAGKIIWYMLIAQLLFILFINSIVLIGADIHNKIQNSYYTIYHNIWKLIFSSSIAISLSYFINDFLVSFCKVKIKLLEQQTIIRILISTGISQAILVSVSYSINFYDLYTYNQIFHIGIDTWIYKMICILAFSPIIFLTSALIKRIDKADAYDTEINYNPFLVFSSPTKKQNPSN